MPQEANISSTASDKDPVAKELAELNNTFSDAVRDELHPLTQGIKPVQFQPADKSPRYHLQADKPQSIKLNGSFLNGNVTFNSLEVGNLSFNADKQTKTLSNIEGLSLNISVFDSNRIMDVKHVQLKEDSEGRKFIDAQIENPLGDPIQRILGMPDTIKVAVPLSRDGLVTPKLSQVFTDASASTGPSIAGLLAADVLNEAAKVSLFVESNPEWVDDVVEPALHEIYANLSKFTGDPKVASLPQVGPVQSGRLEKISYSPPPLLSQLAPLRIEPKHGDHSETVKIKNVDRHYTVHVPPGYDEKNPMPLVIALHGHAQTGDIIAKNTNLNQLADKEGFIAVYPDARIWAGEEAWRAWDTDNGLLPPGEDADDVSFLRTIIDKAETDYAIDPKRIYLAGLSNGGMMSFRAAGDLSDKLAAIAVVSGAMSGIEPAPKHQISVLNIHGTSDKIVPYDGLKNVPPLLTSIGLPKFKPMQYATNFWVGQNQITEPPVVSKHDGVIEKRYINKQSGTEVNEYTILNGRHVPPEISGVTTTVWDFFEAHPKSSGLASGIPQPKEEEPFNLTERVKKHIATRGMRGIEKDVGQMVNELHNLEDGSFSPSSYLQAFERKLDISIDDKLANLVKATEKVTKNGDKISVDYSGSQTIGLSLPGSDSIRFNALKLDDTDFRLTKRNNLPTLSDITGVNLELSAFGRDYSVPIKEVSQNLDKNGDPFYRVEANNPLPDVLQTVMFAKPTIPVELMLNEVASSTVLNSAEVKDATLGWNPVTRGYIDSASHINDLLNKPTWSAGLNTGKDALIVGGSGYLGWRMAGTRYGTKGKVGAAIGMGMLVAPSIIHGIERLKD